MSSVSSSASTTSSYKFWQTCTSRTSDLDDIAYCDRYLKSAINKCKKQYKNNNINTDQDNQHSVQHNCYFNVWLQSSRP